LVAILRAMGNLAVPFDIVDLVVVSITNSDYVKVCFLSEVECTGCAFGSTCVENECLKKLEVKFFQGGKLLSF
uniref:Ovule protein n=1 Tax=Gongylonema pulchrum TaxID=637853 RepID=A0A183DHM8_9BILA